MSRPTRANGVARQEWRREIVGSGWQDSPLSALPHEDGVRGFPPKSSLLALWAMRMADASGVSESWCLQREAGLDPTEPRPLPQTQIAFWEELGPMGLVRLNLSPRASSSLPKCFDLSYCGLSEVQWLFPAITVMAMVVAPVHLLHIATRLGISRMLHSSRGGANRI